MTDIPFGPSGAIVYERTYSRPKADGTRETWPETVRRVVDGNLGLVYGTDPSVWPSAIQAEREELCAHMLDFRIIPAGRHLWASGVKGRQYLFNCHVAPWGDNFSDHFSWTFLRLMEGGGVGANYSMRYIESYAPPGRILDVHIVCDPAHPDYAAMLDADLLSDEYDSDWAGSFVVEDSREGWAAALVDLLDTSTTDSHVKHRARVYDVSNVRAAGARLKTFGGTASGPAPLAVMLHEIDTVLSDAFAEGFWTPLHMMEIDHAIATCVVSGGNRRSARMAMVRWDDPFIMEFLACKSDFTKHWTTNISVEIDDEFLTILKTPHSLYDGGPELWQLAHEVHEKAVGGMVKNGEPGYWNYSLSQQGEVGEVVCTNPCGEITLEEAENCNLGHVNLAAFTDDSEGVRRAHQLMTRFLIRATFGDVNDPDQQAVLNRNRRIGVGHLGVQDFLALRGVRWSQAPSVPWFTRLLRDLYSTVRAEARSYAFELRIPEPVKVTTVAPTGSIAKLPGVGEGIHARYARFFEQRIRFSTSDPDQISQVSKFLTEGYDVEVPVNEANTVIVVFPRMDALVAAVEARGFPAEIVETVDEIPLSAQLAFQAMYQDCYADNAVSFTASIPADAEPAGVAKMLAAWLPQLKGTTVFPDLSRPQAPYTRITREEYEARDAALRGIDDGIDEDCANGACPVR